MDVAVIGLGFGDEGKGMATLYETQRTLTLGAEPVVVRFNGGPQAAHNVRLVRDGRVLHHTHSQFGSGTLLGAKTYYLKSALFDPARLEPEAEHLYDLTHRNVMGWMYVDMDCPVVLPIHVQANRILEEVRRMQGIEHGSTGSGIGIARWCHETLGTNTVRNLLNGDIDVDGMVDAIGERYGISSVLGRDLEAHAVDEDRVKMESLVNQGLNLVEDGTGDLMRMDARLIYEGSQGVLLDERFGYFPHVTYGDMLPTVPLGMITGNGTLREGLHVVGVTRSYGTRHGAGPMPFEGLCEIGELDNVGGYAGKFRTGLLSLRHLVRASNVARIHSLVVSHMDRYPGRFVDLSGRIRKAGEDVFLAAVEEELGRPVTTVGRGPLLDDWKPTARNL